MRPSLFGPLSKIHTGGVLFRSSMLIETTPVMVEGILGAIYLAEHLKRLLQDKELPEADRNSLKEDIKTLKISSEEAVSILEGIGSVSSADLSSMKEHLSKL